jgi:serine/threonine protein phosphatase PrpC
MILTAAAQTDIGLLRSNNEDRYLLAEDLGLFAVADGIGGLPGGAEAAEACVAALEREARAARGTGHAVELAQLLQVANAEVRELGGRLSPDLGLGTTACVVLAVDGVLKIANVGDSRCYLFRGGELRQLTEDDTVENEVKARRAKGENVHLEERYRNALTRCVGQPMPLEIEVAQHALQAGDRILVCSDGITRLVPEAQIAERMAAGKAAAATLAHLVAEALARGGNDNATGIVIDVQA